MSDPSLVYSAKAAATVSSSSPTGWPSSWPPPDGGAVGGAGPWPPGWPLPGGGTGYQITCTAPTLVPVGQVFQLEATTLTSPAGANTAALLNHLISVTCTVDGSTTQLKKTGGTYAETVYFNVTNYSGSKYGFLDAGMQLNIDFTAQAQAVVFTVKVISVSPNLTGTGNSTVDSYNLSVDATSSFAVGQALSLTAYGRSSAGNDVSALNSYTIRVSATIGGSLVQVKKQSGDSYSDYVDYTVTNYSGAHYGFTTSTFYINALGSQDGATATVTAQIVGVSPIISGTDTSLVDGCCDSWCADCPACSGAYGIDLTLSSLPSAGVQSLAGTRTVRACRNCSGNAVDSSARVRVRVANSTAGKCLHVQFYFNPTGNVRAKYNCEAGGGDYAAGNQAWFSMCIGTGGTVDACLDHVVLTCGQQVTLGSWSYDYWCIDASSVDVCDGTGCPAC